MQAVPTTTSSRLYRPDTHSRWLPGGWSAGLRARPTGVSVVLRLHASRAAGSNNVVGRGRRGSTDESAHPAHRPAIIDVVYRIRDRPTDRPRLLLLVTLLRGIRVAVVMRLDSARSSWHTATMRCRTKTAATVVQW